MAKKILLTGGSGFVGRNLLEYIEKKYDGKYVEAPAKVTGAISTITRSFQMLAFTAGDEEYELYAPSSRQLNVIDDETVTEWCTSVYFDIVLHFAVYTNAGDASRDPQQMLAYNLRSFMHFYKCRSLYGRMFYSGSGAEFNKEFDIEKAMESTLESGSEDYTQAIVPADQYGLMKYTIGQLIEASDNIYNVRIFGLFGKYEYASRFITQMCHLSIEGKELHINRNVKFDYLYIEDFCSILLQLIFKDTLKYRSYNIVSGKVYDLISLAKMVNEAAIEYRENMLETGKYEGDDETKLLRLVMQPIVVANDELNNEYTASNARVLEELPDYTYIPMQQAIDELYTYYANETLGFETK